MNYIDYIIIIFVGFFTVRGLFRGLISEVLGLVGVLAALMIATKYMSNTATFISRYIDIPPTMSTILAFLLLFFLTIFFANGLSYLLHKMAEVSFLSWMDKLGGGVVGFLKGGLLISLLLLLFGLLPFSAHLIPGQDESVLMPPTRKFAPSVFNLVQNLVPNSKSFHSEVKESLDALSSTPIGQQTQQFLDTLQPNENDASNGKGEN